MKVDKKLCFFATYVARESEVRKMKKHGVVLLCFLFLISGCKSNQEKSPSTSYEKVIFALKSVNEALKNPTLKEESTKKKRALLNSKGGEVELKAKITPVESAIKKEILKLCFENDRTLENAFDTNIVEYAKIFMESIGESWNQNTVYSTSVSGTLEFNFDTYLPGTDKYPYTMDFLLQVKLDQAGIVNIAVGFDVSLTGEFAGLGFSRYGEMKIVSTYDSKSNDFLLEVGAFQDYMKTPSDKSFYCYEKMFIDVKKNVIQSYEDYYTFADERIILDATHPKWQSYYDEGTRFSDGAKIFDGNKVYQTYINFSNEAKPISLVHKDKLMPFLIDNVGVHEGLNNPAFFASSTVKTDALKTAEQKFAEAFGRPSVYTLLTNLEAIDLDLVDTDVPLSNQHDNGEAWDNHQPYVDETKLLKAMKMVTNKGVEIHTHILIDKNTTVEDLLLGKAKCYDDRDINNPFTLKVKLEYTDNTTGYLDSLVGYRITINDVLITAFSQKIIGEQEELTMLRVDGNNDTTVYIIVMDVAPLLESIEGNKVEELKYEILNELQWRALTQEELAALIYIVRLLAEPGIENKDRLLGTNSEIEAIIKRTLSSEEKAALTIFRSIFQEIAEQPTKFIIETIVGQLGRNLTNEERAIMLPIVQLLALPGIDNQEMLSQSDADIAAIIKRQLSGEEKAALVIFRAILLEIAERPAKELINDLESQLGRSFTQDELDALVVIDAIMKLLNMPTLASFYDFIKLPDNKIEMGLGHSFTPEEAAAMALCRAIMAEIADKK